MKKAEDEDKYPEIYWNYTFDNKDLALSLSPIFP